MKTGRPPLPPLYVLPHGIEVIGEYPPAAGNRYWRVRIRPHPFFHGVRVRFGGIYIHRSRAILASKLGRALTPAEHAHHGEDGPRQDTPTNLEVLSASEHNRHHKTGSRHTAETKARIGAAVKRAFAEGRHSRPAITNRDNLGRIAP